MDAEEYNQMISTGYQTALVCLAMEYRDAHTEPEKRAKVIVAYNNILELLMGMGWKQLLDTDTELPDEVIHKPYLEIKQNKPLDDIARARVPNPHS